MTVKLFMILIQKDMDVSEHERKLI